MSVDAAEVKDVTLDAATELNLRVAKPSAPPAPPSPYSSTGSSREPSSKPSEGGR